MTKIIPFPKHRIVRNRKTDNNEVLCPVCGHIMWKLIETKELGCPQCNHIIKDLDT